MIEKSYNSIVPKISKLPNEYNEILFSIEKRLVNLKELIEFQNITGYIKNIWELISFANKFFNDQKPWELKKNNENQYQIVLFVTVNLIKQIGILINPIMPNTSEKIMKMLNINVDNYEIKEIMKIDLSNVKLNTIIPLFPRIENDNR